MDRTLLGIGAAFASALLLVGLSFSRSVDAPADFRFVNGTEPKTLDPQRMTGQPEGRIAEAIFEGLTRCDERTHEAVPGVARSWEVSPDGKRYTFHLREEARWTDGRPVTAHDLVYSWRRLLDPSVASEYAYLLFAVRHAEALSTFDGHAGTLSAKVTPAILAALSQGSALGGAEWQALLAETGAHDSLKTEPDAVLAELLSRRDRPVTAAELRAVKDTVARVAARLLREAAEARARFGVDEGVVARDDHTLTVELRAPTPYFLDLTSFYPTFPVPRWLVEAPGRADDWFLPEHVVGNGPFRLTRWQVNDRIRLTRSETYWGKSDVKLSAVDALPLENSTTALNLYLTGELDWLPSSYPTDLTDELKRRPDFYSNPALIVYYYRFNTSKPPFHDARVRQAVNLAVDRKVITDVLGLGQIPATTFVPPGIPGYASPDSGISHDVDRARALLADAGFPGGKGFPEVGILYNTHEAHKKVAEIIADQLRRGLGIGVTAYNQEWQSYQDTVRSFRYDMARAGWVGDYTDPNTFLDLWVTNGGNNQTGFASPVYDRLLRAAGDVSTFAGAPESLLAEVRDGEGLRRELSAMSSGSTEARLAAQARLRMLLFREAEGILVRDEFPVMPLYFYVVSGLVHPRVRGFHSMLEHTDGSRSPNLKDTHPLRGMWVEGPRRTP